MVTLKGYKAVRKAVIAALRSGDYQHEVRAGIEVKNLLSTGVVSASHVAGIIERSNGNNTRVHRCMATRPLTAT